MPLNAFRSVTRRSMIRRGISGTQSSVPSPLTSVLRPGVAPVPVAVAARRDPAGGARVVAVEVALFPGARQQDAELVVEEGLAADQGQLGIIFLGQVRIDALDRAGDVGRLAVERTAGDDPHRAADAAFGHRRPSATLTTSRRETNSTGDVAEVDRPVAASRRSGTGPTSR